MEDQLISFETAKLAKEKGFDEECNFVFELGYDLPQRLNYYEGDGNGYIQNSKLKDNSTGNNDYQCIAPTQSLLQRWLREVHNIHITLFPEDDDITKTWTSKLYTLLFGDDAEISYLKHAGIGKDSYEGALEKGLIEALNLLPDTNN